MEDPERKRGSFSGGKHRNPLVSSHQYLAHAQHTILQFELGAIEVEYVRDHLRTCLPVRVRRLALPTQNGCDRLGDPRKDHRACSCPIARRSRSQVAPHQGIHRTRFDRICATTESQQVGIVVVVCSTPLTVGVTVAIQSTDTVIVVGIAADFIVVGVVVTDSVSADGAPSWSSTFGGPDGMSGSCSRSRLHRPPPRAQAAGAPAARLEPCS